MSYPITHVTIKDTPPPVPEIISVGRLYTLLPEQAPEGADVVFSTEERSVEDAETKVVRKNRRTAPPANEDVETK